MKKRYIKTSSNKSFGIVFFLVFLVISIWPLKHGADIRVWALGISILFLILGMMDSKVLSPLNKIWFKFGIFLGNIISPIVMFVIFFIVVTPISIIMRLMGKDILNLKKNNSKSYWIEKIGAKSKMKNQF